MICNEKDMDYIMDEKKIVFIVCVNDEVYFEECRYYINRLEIPRGYKIEVLALREADSMCSAYNYGMRSSDAKYKIYLHQDVFILQKDFLKQILMRFETNPEIGMIGMFGGNELPRSGIIFDGWNEGKVDVREPDMAYHLVLDKKIQEDVIVEAVDGSIMITQYDLPWREDLFTHFDFYDASQAFEFRKKGYKLLVPYQETPWIIHDCGFCKLGNYEMDRKVLVREYGGMLLSDRKTELVYDSEWDKLSCQLARCIRQMLETGDWNGADKAIRSYHQYNFKSTELERLSIMVEIHQSEGNTSHGFFDGLDSYAEMYMKYIRVRFLLRRIEFGMEDAETRELLGEIYRGELSCEAVFVLIVHSVVYKQRLLEKLEEFCRMSGENANCSKIQRLAGIWKDRELPVLHEVGIKKVQEEKFGK